MKLQKSGLGAFYAIQPKNKLRMIYSFGEPHEACQNNTICYKWSL